MSYEQHEWQTGETITAAKLNNLEEGVVDKYAEYDFVVRQDVVNQVDGTPVLVKGVIADVYDALQANIPVSGLFVQITTYTDGYDWRECQFVPLTYIRYYPSAGDIYAQGTTYVWNNDEQKRVQVTMRTYEDRITVSFNTPTIQS